MPSGTEALFNLFLRHLDGSYSLINSVAPTEFPPAECTPCAQIQNLIAFGGASSDFSHVLFETDDIREGTGAPSGFPVGNLYESSGGAVHLVGILPDGAAAIGGAAPGAGGVYFSGLFYSSVATNTWLRVNHAISDNGSKVVFQAAADGGQPDPTQNGMSQVYDRIDGNRTVEVSAPAPGATPANPTAEPAQFWAASTDGSLVFFTSSAELTTASYTGSANNGQDLYRYNIDTEQLDDLTVDSNPADVGTGADVQGVVDISHDGAYVYYVATGELVKGKGVAGQPNLYVQHEDPESHASEVRFIATLSPGDSKDWTATPVELQSYVSPDGRHLAFMSLNSLTGFNNTDQNTGLPDSEIYEYGAGSGLLVCASCDATGRRPTSSAFLGATLEHLASTPFHQPRVMSDDGDRLFFSSSDGLVNRTGSGHIKIYEHEQAGVGSCADEKGCVLMISSDANVRDDVFLDASADGGDVFFSTLSQLAKTDTDELVDVYDARIDGGFAEPVEPTECISDCQALQSPPGALPLQSGFNGLSGNVVPPRARPAVTSAQKLAKALRTCRTRLKRRRRKACEASARKRYGARADRTRAAAHRTTASHRGGRS